MLFLSKCLLVDSFSYFDFCWLVSIVLVFFFFFLKKCSVFMIDFLLRCVYVLILACWLRFRYFFFSPFIFLFCFLGFVWLVRLWIDIVGFTARSSVCTRALFSFIFTYWCEFWDARFVGVFSLRNWRRGEKERERRRAFRIYSLFSLWHFIPKFCHWLRVCFSFSLCFWYFPFFFLYNLYVVKFIA